MALLFLDSFDDRTTNYGDKYAASSSASSNTSLAGRTGNSMRWNPSTNRNLDVAVNNIATVYMGVALRFSAAPATTNDIIRLLDGATNQLIVRINSSRQLVLLNGDGTTLATGATVLATNTFYYIELKATIANSGGVYELRINGTTEFSSSNADTQNSGNARTTIVQLCSTTNVAGSWDVDDFYVDDAQFRGAIKIECKFPSGAGNSNAWTPSAGANYTCVDEATPNDDTDYVSSGNLNDVDTYAYSDLTATAGTIIGVAINLRARKDDLNTRGVSPVTRSGGADYVGSQVAMASAYAPQAQQIRETDPATSSPWSIAGFNAAEFGVKVTQ